MRSVPSIDLARPQPPHHRPRRRRPPRHILITEHDAFVWYRSLAEQGFEPARRISRILDEEKGPAIVFADVTESISLADMTGDGPDRQSRAVRNGEVLLLWPNLGYGRFGPKVTMDHSPVFDRLRPVRSQAHPVRGRRRLGA